MAKYFSQEQLLEDLRKEVSGSTQTAVADKYGISRSMVNEILSGRRDISQHIAEVLGYKRENMFRKIA
jgi:plasmid maintenance system antidote protein VapI